VAIEITEFVHKLTGAHGKNLQSVVLYGAAVAGGQLDNDEPKKVLVVLDRITPADLKNAHAVTEWWRLEGNPPPIYFSDEEIRDSSDVFPIEFIDMSQIRHVIYGRDPFDDLKIDTQNLRHQLEFELRGKLIRLRTLYIPVSRNPNRLARLMADSLDSFTVLFRHVLEMLGHEAPFEKRECLIKLAHALELDTSVLSRIYEYEKDEEQWLEHETTETFGKYLAMIERVIEAVDRGARTENRESRIEDGG
jgi:hypothetical protein